MLDPLCETHTYRWTLQSSNLVWTFDLVVYIQAIAHYTRFSIALVVTLSSILTPLMLGVTQTPPVHVTDVVSELFRGEPESYP